MNRFRKIGKYLGILIIPVIGIAFVIGFEFYFKDNFNSKEVLVANADIDFKKVISEEDLAIAKVKKDYVVEGAFTPDEVESLVNQSAGIEIKAGTQIYPELIDAYNLIPDTSKGEFIAPVPDAWLFAVPGSLRRTYVADFYAIPDSDQAILQSIASSDRDEDEEVLEGSEEIEEYVIGSSKPILTDVVVASVKDGSNREVTESEENENAATGVISNMEIIATDDSLNTLREVTEQGYKIYVVYKYDR